MSDRTIAERVARLKALTELAEEIHQVRGDIAVVIQSVSDAPDPRATKD